MSIVVMGATFVDIKGFPVDAYIPTGRNVGYIEYVHGGVSRNVVRPNRIIIDIRDYIGIQYIADWLAGLNSRCGCNN